MKSKVSFFVPGRLCLFGEHSDWAGEFHTEDPSVLKGLCIIAGTDQGIHAEAEPASAGFTIRQILENGSFSEEVIYRNSTEALSASVEPGNFNGYAAGTASLILEDHPDKGIKLQITHRTLPLKKGLSSSAAICVATARGFNLIHDLNLSVREEMELAYRGELLTGSNCGRMDQACALGSNPVLLSFSGKHMDIERIQHSGTVHVLIADLKSRKNTRKILFHLNQAFSQGNSGIRTALGRENHRITAKAVSALESGDAEALGQLMTEAQEIFDKMVAPCCPEELSAPVLHDVLQEVSCSKLTWGGKGVGSQGDGTVQFICRGLEEREKLKNILELENRYTCYSLTL